MHPCVVDTAAACVCLLAASVQHNQLHFDWALLDRLPACMHAAECMAESCVAETGGRGFQHIMLTARCCAFEWGSWPVVKSRCIGACGHPLAVAMLGAACLLQAYLHAAPVLDGVWGVGLGPVTNCCVPVAVLEHNSQWSGLHMADVVCVSMCTHVQDSCAVWNGLTITLQPCLVCLKSVTVCAKEDCVTGTVLGCGALHDRPTGC